MRFFSMVVALGLAIPLALQAHHSLHDYDRDKTGDLVATVTKFQWANPHVEFAAEVTDAAGNKTAWTFEMRPPNGMIKTGWKKTDVKLGDVVTVRAYLSKDGSPKGVATQVKLADGRVRRGWDDGYDMRVFLTK